MKFSFLACLISFALYADDSNIVRLDPAADKLIPEHAKLEKIATGFRFVEGPIWVKSCQCLYFSDMMGNAIYKWTQDSGAAIVRKPIFPGAYPDTVLIGSNGLTVDRQGRLLAAEQGNRRVTRTEKGWGDHGVGRSLRRKAAQQSQRFGRPSQW